MVTDDNYPEVCLIVKDVDKTDRDYEKTIRKYQALIDKNNLGALIKKVILGCLNNGLEIFFMFF